MNRRKIDETATIAQRLEDIQDRMCDEYCKWPSQYPLDTDDDAYDRIGAEHCDNCPIQRLIQEAAVEKQDDKRSYTDRTSKMHI